MRYKYSSTFLCNKNVRHITRGSLLLYLAGGVQIIVRRMVRGSFTEISLFQSFFKIVLRRKKKRFADVTMAGRVGNGMVLSPFMVVSDNAVCHRLVCLVEVGLLF